MNPRLIDPDRPQPAGVELDPVAGLGRKTRDPERVEALFVACLRARKRLDTWLTQAGGSKEIKRFLEGRSQRRSGSLQVFLVLRAITS